MARIGLGVLLPLNRGSTGYFRQGFDALTQVHSNLVHLLMTAKGERIFNPTFGCDIHSLVFDNITPNLEADVEASIQEAVAEWIPQLNVSVRNIVRSVDSNRIEIVVDYSLKTNVSNQNSVTLVL